MPTSPPHELDVARPRVLAEVDPERFERHARDEGILFLCVENAPREACRTEVGADGSLTFRTALAGRVLSVERGALTLDTGGRLVTLRHLLPSGIELEALAGRRLQVALTQTYPSRGRATIDAEIRDVDGRLVLWAHDGRHPDDRDARGLSLRATLGDGAARLAVRTDDGIASLACPGLAGLSVARRAFALALVRLGPDDIGFVLLRR